MLRKNILGWSCMAKIPSGCGFGICPVSHIRMSWSFARCPRPYTNSSRRLLATSRLLARALPFPLFQCSAQSKHKPSRTSHGRTFRRTPHSRHSISSSIASEKILVSGCNGNSGMQCDGYEKRFLLFTIIRYYEDNICR